MSDVEMIETWINDRWPLLLPKHRHDRPEWPHWEAGRLASMWHELAAFPTIPPYDDGFYRPEQITRTNHVVYDIGAEEGDFPALWSSWGCDVVLFEPNDRVWPNIKAIWEANDLRRPLAMFAGFAGPDDDTSVRFTRSEGTMDDGRVWPESAYGEVIHDHGFKNLCENVDTPSISVDEMARWVAPPTAITMDIEGAEYEAMLGAQETLRQHRPLVWISVHPGFAAEMYGRRHVINDLRDLFDACGYDEGEHIATDHEQHWLWRPL